MRCDRRLFLTALTAAGASLAACSTNTAQAPGPGDLEHFLALSAILTGFASLDNEIGATYLNAIRAVPARSSALNDLFARAGFTKGSAPTSLDDLQKAGAFSNFAFLSLTSEILENWYTGIRTGDGAQKTVTWTDALAWKASRFTKAPSVCAAPGSWAHAPSA